MRHQVINNYKQPFPKSKVGRTIRQLKHYERCIQKALRNSLLLVIFRNIGEWVCDNTIQIVDSIKLDVQKEPHVVIRSQQLKTKKKFTLIYSLSMVNIYKGNTVSFRFATFSIGQMNLKDELCVGYTLSSTTEKTFNAFII